MTCSLLPCWSETESGLGLYSFVIQAKAAEVQRQRREMGTMGGTPYSPPYSPGRASMSGRRASLSDTPLEGTPYLLRDRARLSARV